MEFTTRKAGKGVFVVEVPFEELDASNAPEFKAGLQPLLEKQTKVVLDLGRLDFVDSSGLGAFLSCLKTMRATNGILVFGGVSRNVRNVLELVHMYKLVEYFDTVEEAVDRLAR